MADPVFLVGEARYGVTSINMALVSAASNPGNTARYPISADSARRLANGDDLWVVVTSKSTATTYSFPTGWTQQFRTVVTRGASTNFLVELWHYGTVSASWASIAPTITVSGSSTDNYAHAVAVTTRIVNDPQVEIYNYPTSQNPTSPTTNVTAGDKYAIALAGGVAPAGGNNRGLDFSPDATSQNGWVEFSSGWGESGNYYGGTWFGNDGSMPPTLPSYSTPSTYVGNYWLIFGVAKTAGAGWSVGRLAY